MVIIDSVIQVIKEQKGIFIGIVLFCVLLGALIGFMKKREIKIIELDPKQIYRESVLNKISTQKSEEQNYNERIDKAVESGESYPTPEKAQEDLNIKKTEPDPFPSKEPYRDSFSDSQLQNDKEKPMDENIDKALDENKEKTGVKEKKEINPSDAKKQKPQSKDIRKEQSQKENSTQKKQEPEKQKPEAKEKAENKTEKPLSSEEKNELLNLNKIPQKNKVEVYQKNR